MPDLLTWTPYLLLACGLCFGIANKLPWLHDRFGQLDRLLDCPYCLGFHCGWVAWLVYWGINGETPVTGVVPIILSIGAWGVASAFTCLLADSLHSWLDMRQAVPDWDDEETTFDG